MNNKILGIVFLALLGVFALSKMFSGKTESSFKSNIIEADPATITEFKIYNKADDKAEVILKKEGDSWTATKGAITVPAEKSAVDGMLTQLKLVKAKRIAAKKPEKWTEFEVDEASNNVKVFAGSKMLYDIYVGRFNFNQQTRSGISYVRLSGSDNVYAVDGFLSMSLGQGFNNFRDKNILKLDKTQITAVQQNSDKASFSILKTDGQWQTAEGVALDSTKVDAYLMKIVAVNGSDFVDDANPASFTILPTQTVQITTNEKATPVTLSIAFKEGDEKPFLIKSSENTAYFRAEEKGIPARVIATLADLQ